MKRNLLLIIGILMMLVLGACSSSAPVQEEPTEKPPEVPPEQIPEEPEPVKTELEVTTVPGTGRVGERLDFSWEIKADEGVIASHTAVHYGSESESKEMGTDVGPGATSYSNPAGEFLSGSFKLPRSFSASFIPVEDGMLYLRFHAAVGDENLWSNEYSVAVAPLLQEIEESDDENEDNGVKADHVITVSESGFDPSSLTVKVGDTVQWKNVRTKVSNGMTQLFRAPRSEGSIGFKSPKFYNGETFEWVFEEDGKLIYVDAIYSSQSGQITIDP